ncbi:MAG: 50S ribosomal protein L5 [Candidatus Lokiarchaeota archaeon]|nr:50S ribosomal protein L5 [Candidatus Lokiarchaeota archaeon]
MDEEKDNIVEISNEIRKKFHENWSKHPMRKPRIEKITVNVGVGASGLQLEKAMNVLESLTGQKPVKRNSRKTIRGWGIRKYEPISTIVTLRGEQAVEFLKKTLEIHENQILVGAFDDLGNFAFGVKEHIEIPGTQYDPKLGIFGMDICVNINRRGHRISKRSYRRKKIPKRHKMEKDEAMTFLQDEFGVSYIRQHIISYY